MKSEQQIKQDVLAAMKALNLRRSHVITRTGELGRRFTSFRLWLDTPEKEALYGNVKVVCEAVGVSMEDE